MSQNKINVTIDDIEKARSFLLKHIQPTPLLKNLWLSEIYGCEVYLKLESMQPIGSFKIRGATYKISSLTEAEKKKGVIAASAGNHGQGVAWGARALGVDAMVVMPVNAPLIKVHNTKGLHAKVHLEGETYDDAYQAAKRIAEQTGRVFVHAYEDPNVIAGQGTAGLELIDQLPDMDAVIGSIGGGGLLAGVGTVLRERKPNVHVIGGQASGASSMVDAMKSGKVTEGASVRTFADGIAVRQASVAMKHILEGNVDEFLTVSDEAIAGAVLSYMEKARILVEGAGAVPLAVLDQVHKKLSGKKVVLMVSGGNIDVNLISRIIDRGLVRSGRRLHLRVIVKDKPGSLRALTALIAQQGANVLQAIHDQTDPAVGLDETEISFVLETSGPEHSRQVIEAVNQNQKVEQVEVKTEMGSS